MNMMDYWALIENADQEAVVVVRIKKSSCTGSLVQFGIRTVELSIEDARGKGSRLEFEELAVETALKLLRVANRSATPRVVVLYDRDCDNWHWEEDN